MVLDGLRGYLQLANGLTDVTRERAMAAARTLAAQGASVNVFVPGPVRSQVSSLTDDLLATSRMNRDLLLNLVRGEVERSVARLGLVSSQELDAANRRSRGLEVRVTELEASLLDSSAAPKPAAKKAAAKKATAKKATAKKATAKKATAKKASPAPAASPAASTAPAAPAAPTAPGASGASTAPVAPTSTGSEGAAT